MRAISLDFWDEVPGGKLRASMTWVREVTVYPASLSPSLVKLLWTFLLLQEEAHFLGQGN